MKQGKMQRCFSCMNLKQGNGSCPYCGCDSQAQNEPYQLKAGTVLHGRYLIGRVLGQGGYGITYMGYYFEEDVPVAVKEYFPFEYVMREQDGSGHVISKNADSQFEDGKKRFLREYEVLAGISDIPGIVQVREFLTANGTVYIVMEYIEGITLKQYAEKKGGKLPKDELFALLKPVMESLDKLHKNGLVHRDISPDNIMVLPDRTAKLLDFGAVREVNVQADADHPLTRPTETIVKKGYAPMEQYQSRGSLGPWTDVYAFCATIYDCLTGKIPPEAPQRLLMDEPLMLRENGADVTPSEETVLLKGMELRTRDRIPDMGQLYRELFLLPANAEETDQFNEVAKKQEEVKASGEKWLLRMHRKWIPAKKMLVLPVVMAIMGGSLFYFGQDIKQEPNKVIQAPIIFEPAAEEDDGTVYSTWISVNCGEVESFSDSYTYSYNIYIPKAACADEHSIVSIATWMDLRDDDMTVGTCDSSWRYSFIHEDKEFFPVVWDDKKERYLQQEEYDMCFHVYELEDFYRLQMQDAAINSRMHVGENYKSLQKVPQGRSGELVINVQVALEKLCESFSSVVYLDDIVIKDHGTVIKSVDCSAQSLYGRSYFYRIERDYQYNVEQKERPPLVELDLGSKNHKYLTAAE